ncbi:MAG: DUF4422 domain-containing protein [Bavariicoccus seileri]|uniref:DUF4422 domain-containing protein n=1 Tax=Bavariicoccus seileri TaxID=549685 RepID=UPI003F939458
MELKILVATHKKAYIPKLPDYYPIQVGAKINGRIDGFLWDDTGNNISTLNPYYSELTAIYWAWKNLEDDYIGLVHYRRFFAAGFLSSLKKSPISRDFLSPTKIEEILTRVDIILPKKRNYYIESVYEHYTHTLNKNDLIETEKIIARRCPDYLEEFEKLKIRRSAHMFNMFIMSREMLNQYCSWLFPILEELLACRGTEFDAFHNRYPGRVSELLFDVWIHTNKYSYAEQPLLFIGGRQLVKKAYSLLKSKVTKRNYTSSF